MTEGRSRIFVRGLLSGFIPPIVSESGFGRYFDTPSLYGDDIISRLKWNVVR